MLATRLKARGRSHLSANRPHARARGRSPLLRKDTVGLWWPQARTPASSPVKPARGDRLEAAPTGSRRHANRLRGRQPGRLGHAAPAGVRSEGDRRNSDGGGGRRATSEPVDRPRPHARRATRRVIAEVVDSGCGEPIRLLILRRPDAGRRSAAAPTGPRTAHHADAAAGAVESAPRPARLRPLPRCRPHLRGHRIPVHRSETPGDLGDHSDVHRLWNALWTRTT